MHGGGGGGGSGGDELGRRRAASDFRTYLRPWRDAPLLMPRLGRRVEVRRPHPVHPARNNTEGYSVQTGRATDTTAASGETRERQRTGNGDKTCSSSSSTLAHAQLNWAGFSGRYHHTGQSPPSDNAASSLRSPGPRHMQQHPLRMILSTEQTTPRLDRGRPWMVAHPTYYTLCYLAIPQSQPVQRDLDTAVRRVSGTHRSPPLDRGSVSWTEATSDDDHLHQLHLSLR